jgi:hypothetical protein
MRQSYSCELDAFVVATLGPVVLTFVRVGRRMVKVATDLSELPIHRDNLIESGAGN